MQLPIFQFVNADFPRPRTNTSRKKKEKKRARFTNQLQMIRIYPIKQIHEQEPHYEKVERMS